MENNNSEEQKVKEKELEQLVSLIKDVQRDGISTVIVYSRKGRIEIYNGLIDNLYVIASRLKCIADNETNEQIRVHRQKTQLRQSGIIVPN